MQENKKLYKQNIFTFLNHEWDVTECIWNIPVGNNTTFQRQFTFPKVRLGGQIYVKLSCTFVEYAVLAVWFLVLRSYNCHSHCLPPSDLSFLILLYMERARDKIIFPKCSSVFLLLPVCGHFSYRSKTELTWSAWLTLKSWVSHSGGKGCFHFPHLSVPPCPG